MGIIREAAQNGSGGSCRDLVDRSYCFSEHMLCGIGSDARCIIQDTVTLMILIWLLSFKQSDKLRISPKLMHFYWLLFIDRSLAIWPKPAQEQSNYTNVKYSTFKLNWSHAGKLKFHGSKKYKNRCISSFLKHTIYITNIYCIQNEKTN